MSQAQASANTDLVSKVSFFPVEDRTGENKALIVTIKKVVPEGDELFRRMESPKRSMSMESPKRSMSMDSKRKTRSSRTSTDKSKNKSTMTEDKGVSLSTQTAVELPVPSISGGAGLPSLDSSPCLKHAAQNISSKASHIPSEKVSLCNNCSKSMLSYIFLVQDFLDSLAKEICGDTDSKNCVQCLRQENRISVIEETAPKAERKSSKSRSKSSENLKSASSKQGDDSRTKKSALAKDSSREVRRYEETAEKLIQRSISEHQKIHQHSPSHQEGSSFTSEGQKEGSQSYYQGDQTSHNRLNDHSGSSYHQGPVESSEQQNRSQDYSGTESQRDQSVSGHISQQDLVQQRSHHGLSYPQDNIHPGSSAEQIPPVQQHEQQMASYQENSQASNWSSQDDKLFRKPMDRQQPNFTDSVFHEHKGGEGSNQDSFHNAEGVSSPFSDGMDNFVAPLSNIDREVYDAARNGAGWEGLSESQERLTVSSNRIASEAFVTMCRNNAEALGCLAVGTSLLLSRTSRTLCVVVSDGVSNAFRASLANVFHVVQCVRSMDSLGTTKLALLEQPELGISFEKLNVWRLLQFNKCVYLNPDTLVIKNCDELFCHNELSAVPDIGWPDCFNSGVFVFVPSIQTFWQLLDFAEKQGSYDGGDQGLLNSYFHNWSEDIGKKLSFIYNLMANVSYTYTPAYKQFGRNVKIVQFHGSFKPWHVKFFSRTGQISPATAVHPTYVQFVYIWIKIFRLSALQQLSQEIQNYALSQEVYCAVELLRFFPLPTESEAEFFLTPPSVRLRLAERKLQKPSKISEAVHRRKSAEYTPFVDKGEEATEETVGVTQKSEDTTSTRDVPSTSDEVFAAASGATEQSDASVAEALEVPKEATVKSLLPGAEVGNYQGMKAWEQGRMDYQGTDSSDGIIKRLEFLMSQPK